MIDTNIHKFRRSKLNQHHFNVILITNLQGTWINFLSRRKFSHSLSNRKFYHFSKALLLSKSSRSFKRVFYPFSSSNQLDFDRINALHCWQQNQIKRMIQKILQKTNNQWMPKANKKNENMFFGSMFYFCAIFPIYSFCYTSSKRNIIFIRPLTTIKILFCVSDVECFLQAWHNRY